MSQKTDRELLELAAKAAGLRFAINGDDLPGYIAVNSDDWRHGWTYWNPLVDNGDALRLAVKLDINLSFSRKYVTACADSHAGVGVSQYEKDRNVATRSAIVHAAAAIGESMQPGEKE